MTISRRDLLASSVILASSSFAGSAFARAVAALGDADASVNLTPLRALVVDAVANQQTPGIALSVWKGGKEIGLWTAGFANLETGARVTAQSVFRVGSLTKQFAGALVLKLVADGKLALEDPAQKHLPFLAKHESFTVLELLNQTAGVRDGEYDTNGLQAHSQVEQAKRIAQLDPFFDFRPGTAWLYSNANYILIGAIIEQVTGKPLDEIARELLIKPMGLAHTAFDAPAEIVAGRASGYTPTGDPDRPFQNPEFLDVALTGAAGAMRSTASDLCRFHHALFHGDVLPAELVAKMIAPGRLRDGTLSGTNRFSESDRVMGDVQYGLGLMLDTATKDKSLIVAHHGGINGFAAYLASHVDSGLTYACLCNVDTHPGVPFRDVRRAVFANVLPTGKR
jgi:D-alanyl-D-alanine carboxypeptidase